MKDSRRNIAYRLLGLFLLMAVAELSAAPLDDKVSDASAFVLSPASHGAAPNTLLRIGGDAEESEVRVTTYGYSPYVGEFHSVISGVALDVIRRLYVLDFPRQRILILFSILRV